MKSLRATALLLSVGLSAVGGFAQAQDAASGEKIFKKCSACHKVGADATNGAGPVLNDLFGRVAGSFEGYNYSKTLLAAKEAELIWDVENVAEYITDPKAFMQAFLNDSKARPKMNFKLRDEQDRKDVVAYLQQFSAPAEDGEDEEAMNRTNSADQDLAALAADNNQVCVQNASAHSHFFAAEGKGVERLTATLSPGEHLCATVDGDGWAGVVSVYEASDGFEGCSRLVKPGTVERLFKYVDFDRCLWSSNSAT